MKPDFHSLIRGPWGRLWRHHLGRRLSRLWKRLRSHQPSLETLPIEIMLDIMCELTDLDALYNLIRASPVSSRIFDRYANEVIEAVLPMCPLKIEIQHLVRAVILTRSSALPFDNLRDFKTLFEQQDPWMSGGYRSPPLTLPSDSLKAAGLESLRSCLATACRISVLTYTCLEFYLERLRNKSICNPYHCDNRDFSLDDFLQNTTHSWTRAFGEPVTENYGWSPSWVEEMRVARALWKMQLVGEVQRLAIRDPNGLGWSAEDMAEIANITPEDFVTSPDLYLNGMEQEAMTVGGYLRRLGGEDGESPQRSLADYYRLPRPPAIEIRSWITEMPKPNIRKTKFAKYYDLGNRLIPADPPIESLELLVKKPYPLYYIIQGLVCGQKPIDADKNSFGVVRYMDLAFRDAYSPLPEVPFDTFGLLGIALWDNARLRKMCLVENAYYSRVTTKCYFVWRSLLPEEQIEQAAQLIRDQDRMA
ncbi:uncharacterized protein TrAtP1_007444 [Trichoderma atroviride]|uniref:uncharacterized protein n=1 Tax=Hypocrea atroviridis TaxID=63577 RepID=UPI0033224524|nr:hypothetical protein TrAtP1_007444 [Trichoderma atroviride]